MQRKRCVLNKTENVSKTCVVVWAGSLPLSLFSFFFRPLRDILLFGDTERNERFVQLSLFILKFFYC